MIKKLRTRFIRIAMLSVAAVMLLLTLILNGANFLSTNADLNEMLTHIAENHGTLPAPADEPSPAPTGGDETPPEPKDAAPLRPNARRNDPFGPEAAFSTRFFVLRCDAGGALLSAELDRIAAVTEDSAADYLAAALRHGEGYGFIGDYKFLVTADGEGYMAVFLDCYQEMRALRLVLGWSLAADAACILLVLLLVLLLSRRAIDPVVRSAEQQKQFITDASHELKTPITVIATSLRVLEMETGKQKWIDKALAQTEKLTGLVNSLVTLSRMDEEESPLKTEDFDLSAAVEETAESFRDFAAERGHTLTLAVAPELTLRGDEYALRQLVSILLDNAVKYAAPDSPISLSLERSRRGVTLLCANRCEGAETIETDRLFDRFYRADPSRSSGGYGIGLAIARSIVEAHRGTIRAEVQGDEIAFVAELR